MKKILFVGMHRIDRSPSQRFRFEQYLKFLESNNFQWEISYLVSAKADKFFYKPGNYLGKFFVILTAIWIRVKDAFKASSYDIIFIQREAFPTGTYFFEKLFSRSKAKVVYDFDDAIWLQHISESHKKFSWIKNPKKIAKIISLSDLVFAGNSFLAGYARQFNNNVVVVPTTIDTTYHKPNITIRNQDQRVCIGWTGTFSTLKYFEGILPQLKALKDKYKERVYFKIIADRELYYEDIDAQTTIWSKAREIEDLNELDIGIMPLVDDQWSQGKCGFKGLQYMALGIPTIMAAVGVNKEIIDEGENGFLVINVEDWVTKLSALVESKTLRETIGERGRKTVEEKYSVNANKEKYLKHLSALVEEQ